jgi:hypothetical protein
VAVPVGQHGLAALAGTSPDMGVTGYTPGGGLGWLARRYGLAANSVTAAADLPAAAIDTLVAVAGPYADTSLASVEIRHLGGALARPAPGGGAQPAIDASYLTFAAGFTPTPELVTMMRAQAQGVKDALTPLTHPVWPARH